MAFKLFPTKAREVGRLNTILSVVLIVVGVALCIAAPFVFPDQLPSGEDGGVFGRHSSAAEALEVLDIPAKPNAGIEAKKKIKFSFVNSFDEEKVWTTERTVGEDEFFDSIEVGDQFNIDYLYETNDPSLLQDDSLVFYPLHSISPSERIPWGLIGFIGGGAALALFGIVMAVFAFRAKWK